MIQQQKLQSCASVHIKETRCPKSGSDILASMTIEKSPFKISEFTESRTQRKLFNTIRNLLRIFVVRHLNSYEVIWFKHQLSPFSCAMRDDI